MDRIEMTDEMRQRILSNIRELTREPMHRQKFRYGTLIWRCLPIAACFVILLAGALSLLRLQLPSELVVAPAILEAGSAAELSELVGFEMEDILSLPFQPKETIYRAYGDSLAQIIYINESDSVDYRKSPGMEDNSGDYSVYDEMIEISTGAVTATLKGTDGIYSLAVWTDGTYSYSLRLSQPFAQEEWADILKGIVEN